MEAPKGLFWTQQPRAYKAEDPNFKTLQVKHPSVHSPHGQKAVLALGMFLSRGFCHIRIKSLLEGSLPRPIRPNRAQ